MNFELDHDRRMLADMLARYITHEYGFAERDRIAQSVEGCSAAHWQQFAELGVIGALFSGADGGLGGTGFDLMVVFEAVGRGLVVEPLLGTVLAGSAIAHCAGGDRRAALGQLIGGSSVAALAHAEPASSYALSAVQTMARPADGGWLLNGSKTAIPQGEAAGLFIVSARTAGEYGDEAGISLFAVARDTPGVGVTGYPDIDGGRSADLVLDKVALPADALLGAEGMGFGTLVHCIGRGTLALCAEALGAMDAARDATLEYLRTRRQFGVPIGRFQALQHRMADLLLDIEQSRSAVINAAAALDAPGPGRERALSAAKYTVGRIGARVAEECIQMHGGIGMTWELPLAHYAKRLVMIDHQLGDMDYHLERYIALGHA